MGHFGEDAGKSRYARGRKVVARESGRQRRGSGEGRKLSFVMLGAKVRNRKGTSSAPLCVPPGSGIEKNLRKNTSGKRRRKGSFSHSFCIATKTRKKESGLWGSVYEEGSLKNDCAG